MRRCEGLRPSRTSGKRAADDDAHGVRQVALLELVFDRQIKDSAAMIIVGELVRIGRAARGVISDDKESPFVRGE